MSRRRVLSLVATLLALTPIVTTILALQNKPWTHSPLIRNAQSVIAELILSRLDVVTVPGDQDIGTLPRLSPSKRAALEQNELRAVSASEVGVGYSGTSSHRFTIVTIEPLDLIGKSRAEQRRVIKRVDDLAVAGKVDAIVEATASDTVRSDDWGVRETRRLEASHAIRCVVFDGGHHVSAMPLAPDILLVPVMQYRGERYIAHWFTRDSIPACTLTEVLKENELESLVAEFPRSGIPVKIKSGMAHLAAQAILEADTRRRREERSRRQTTPRLSDAHTAQPHIGQQAKQEVLFLSINVNRSAGKQVVLSKVEEALHDQRQNRAIEHVYIGVTCGNSCFPYRSKSPGFDRAELEAYLNARLAQTVTVLSEPLSAWDIYLDRIGIGPSR